MPRPVLAGSPARFQARARRLLALLPALVLAMALLTAVLPAGALARTATPETGAAVAARGLVPATEWLLAQQTDAGAFPGLSGDPDPGTTADAVVALAAAEASDPNAAAGLAAAVAYLDQEGKAYAATGAGQAAKLAMAAVAGGRDPRAFAGVDLLAAMQAPPAQAAERAIPGIYGPDLYSHALVLIAFVAAGEPVPETALAPFRATQQPSGGWAFDGAADAKAADSNTTAVIVQSLVATGHGDDPMVDRALAYLATLRAADGNGFASGPADPLVADANSTALVLQALIAAGEDPTSADWGNAPAALLQFQTPEGGLRYMASDSGPNLLATLQAIPALAGRPLPVAIGCAQGESPGTGGCLPLAA